MKWLISARASVLIMTFCAVFKWFKTEGKKQHDDAEESLGESHAVSSIKIKDVNIHGAAVFGTFAILYALYLWFIDIADLYVLESVDGYSVRQRTQSANNERVHAAAAIEYLEAEDSSESDAIAALNLSLMTY